jgi:two-component system CheB/CheR fusion protein
VVRQALETCRPTIDARPVQLRHTASSGATLVEADASRLAQVFCNLVSNAVKFSEPGAAIEVTSGAEGGRALVRVRDFGAGIPPGMLRSVFELFVQADQSLARSQGGLGVGLTIAKLITELHGGTIEARSEGAGRGSEFIVSLPLREGTAATGARSEAADTRPVASRRVLVVDDNVDAARSLAAVARALGHGVEVAHDGASALATHAKLRPDVVLLDLGMPGMDGFEVARRLRESDDEVLIVAISGYGAAADRRKTRAAGFDHHVTKPVSAELLQRLLAR